ncbi:hypothetical protein [Clostridium rectalis]|uniref:hypothetical protein n=1 Tax=Clostridium rectalis TaxID=2040295 RepID=UPI000F636464|nr:hypothetical protein [Clostridium rectalis]
MKKRNNFMLRTAMFAAAVGLGTYIYKKFSHKNYNNEESEENCGIIEIEELDFNNTTSNENTCCSNNDETDDTDFQINLDETAMEENNNDNK